MTVLAAKASGCQTACMTPTSSYSTPRRGGVAHRLPGVVHAASQCGGLLLRAGVIWYVIGGGRGSFNRAHDLGVAPRRLAHKVYSAEAACGNLLLLTADAALLSLLRPPPDNPTHLLRAPSLRRAAAYGAHGTGVRC